MGSVEDDGASGGSHERGPMWLAWVRRHARVLLGDTSMLYGRDHAERIPVIRCLTEVLVEQDRARLPRERAA